eukprot:scaffold276182_cov43-Prasinocladus_malaysianus.AAC.1
MEVHDETSECSRIMAMLPDQCPELTSIDLSAVNALSLENLAHLNRLPNLTGLYMNSLNGV